MDLRQFTERKDIVGIHFSAMNFLRHNICKYEMSQQKEDYFGLLHISICIEQEVSVHVELSYFSAPNSNCRNILNINRSQQHILRGYKLGGLKEQ